MSKKNKITAISLFSSGGIGDLALEAAGADLLVANELLEDRAQTLAFNFKNTYVIIGDIRKNEDVIAKKTLELLNGRELDILFATPPCQGMSKNGRGKLLQGIRAGLKPQLDERNSLIIHAVNLILTLNPRLVVFENVPEMKETVISDPKHPDELINIMEYVRRELAPNYVGDWKVVEFADYGVPQRRQRLITVFSRVKSVKALIQSDHFLPNPTHAKEPNMFTKRWISVEEALAGIESLDAKNDKVSRSKTTSFHYVPVLDENKYFWVSNTPPGKGAFDNQCVNPKCKYKDNPTHGAKHDKEGINRSFKETTVHCVKCNSLLPRPWVEKAGQYRIMSGFTSAYKRMRGDLPASALTSNLSYACSDQKIHPTENRVLSLHEAFILHTIADFDFEWKRLDGKRLPDKSIREMIGESIPPRGLKIIFDYLISNLESTKTSRNSKVEDSLRSPSRRDKVATIVSV